MRFRLRRRDPYAGPRLSGLAKLVAAIAVAGLGFALAVALAQLSGDDDSATGVSGGPPAASSPDTTTTARTRTTRASTSPQKPDNDVRVRIVSAILHPAATATGQRRRCARLSVHVRVTNRGSRRISPARPVLVSGDDRVKTDPPQDTAETHLGAINPGETGDVTLRFEAKGAVTERLRRKLRARLTIAGRNVTATVKVGRPVSVRNASRFKRRPTS